jgi:hypothetical protein
MTTVAKCTFCGLTFVSESIRSKHRKDSVCATTDGLRADGWSIRSDGAWTRMVRGEHAYTTPAGHRVFRV